MAVNADEQDVSLEITLEDESTPMEGVIFSMYQITDGITAPDGQSLKFMPILKIVVIRQMRTTFSRPIHWQQM